MKAGAKLEKLIKFMLQADQAQRLRGDNDKSLELTDRFLYAITKTILSGSSANVVDVSAKSLFALAMILHHAGNKHDLVTAQALAERAAAQGHPNARWLWAAIDDRRRIMKGKSQRFGTQFSYDKTGAIVLKPVDETFSDKDRLSLGLPTLKEVYESIEMRNASLK